MEPNVETYLRSDEAAHDLVGLLKEAPTPSIALPGTSYAGRGPWMLSRGGAWAMLNHRHIDAPGGLRVYFRELAREDIPLGSANFTGWTEAPVGHYAVTDLGDGNRALKMRTGAMEGGEDVWDPVCEAAGNVLGPQVTGEPARVAWTWNGGDLYLPAVAPADLPRRLCQVLLAAYRIARLEVPARRAKCDGNHGGPRCSDPGCWNDEVPR